MQITKVDVYWNYTATFFRIAAGALLLPFVLIKLPSDTVGIWTIFMTINTFAAMFDFGFNPSFTRNITSVFSGVQNIRKEGYEKLDEGDLKVNYGLLKAMIKAMKWFYLRMSLIILLLLSVGTLYIMHILEGYTGSHNEVYIAWGILCFINAYRIYSMYYESLLLGKGLVKRSKQIQILGHIAYLCITIIFVLLGFGLIAIVSAQAISVFIIRIMSYKSFFTADVLSKVNMAPEMDKKIILNAIYPNAIKMGLTMVGSFLVNRSSIIIGATFLTLEQIASYGITLQLISIISSLGGVYLATYQPKIVKYQVEKNLNLVKETFIKSQGVLLITFLVCGFGFIFFGNWALQLIGSDTELIERNYLGFLIIVALLEQNHVLAAGILLTKNEVPFYKASLISGALTVIFLYVMFYYFNLGLLSMVLAPGIAQLMYQNWKWPKVVNNELNIKFSTYISYMKNYLFRYKQLI